MNIDKFKHQHADIMSNISALRRLAQAGGAQNAADIARLIVRMRSTNKLHLAEGDQAPYPALQRGDNPDLARMGQKYQTDMGPIAQAYEAFARRWNRADSVLHDE